MFKIYRKYIFGEFLKNLFIGIFSIILIFSVIESLMVYFNDPDGFQIAGGAWKLFIHVAETASRLFGQVAAILSLFAAVITLMNLESTVEITAMNSLKISLWQIMNPMFVGGFFVVLMIYVNNAYIKPLIEQAATSETETSKINSSWQLGNKKLILIQHRIPYRGKFDSVKVYQRDNKNELEKISVYENVQVEKDGTPVGYDSVKWIESPQNQLVLETGSEKTTSEGLNALPKLRPSQKNYDTASFNELWEIYRERKNEGLPTDLFLMSIYRRIAGLLSVPILIFAAFPLTLQGPKSINFNRGILVCIFVSYTYYIMNESFGVLVKKEVISAFIGNFMANFLFLVAGIYLFLTRKQP